VSGDVIDTWGLTGLYSGRTTYRYTQAAEVLHDPHLAYVVLESRELEFTTTRGETLRTLLAAAAEPVAHFASPLAAKGQRAVVVYRWYPDRFAQWLTAGLQEHSQGSDDHAQARSSVHRDRSPSF
jgi:hypothetical protein